MKTLFESLIDRRITVATAESCTGGNIAASFVAYPGISDVFLAGLVTYANSAKEQVLGVEKRVLDRFGAVSYECAFQMLAGARRVSGADAAVCTTGIAGPGGGSKEKPVGLVYVGVSCQQKSIVEKCCFSGTRQEIIRQATDRALLLLDKQIKQNGGDQDG
ncbi:MAG: CinA family protein [Clostridia bacterium]|nr:CinA family protein [Clostridia bacterium]